MTDRQLMFVAGHGRSGTTALMSVLMAHPEVVLGCERYKRLWGSRIAEITPDFWERERFFDFSDGLTNLTPEQPKWAKHYDQMAAKWDTATYVGDKMTLIRIQQLWATYPQARFVCIVRDPAQVAFSWEARAQTEGDPWPSTSGARVGVERWNTATRRIRRAARMRPDLVAIVEYDRFFGDPEATSLHRVLDFLCLETSPRLEQAQRFVHNVYTSSLVDKDRSLSPEDAAYVAETVDQQVWDDVRAMAL